MSNLEVPPMKLSALSSGAPNVHLWGNLALKEL